MPRQRFTTALALLIVAAISYSGVPWEWILNTTLSPSTSFLSELAALDQPSSTVFRLLDVAAGVAIVIAAIVMGRPVHDAVRRRWYDLAALIALGVFGLGTILDVSFPMDCAPSVTQACAASEAAGDLGIVHQLHTYASVMADGGAVALALAVLLICGVGARALHGPAAWTARIAAAVSVLSSAVVSVMALMPSPGEPLPEGTGYAQRLQTLVFCVLLVVLAPVVRAALDHRRGDMIYS